MNDRVFKKINILVSKAKEVENRNTHNKQGLHTANSLADNIKTKEQADTFKKLLKAL